MISAVQARPPQATHTGTPLIGRAAIQPYALHRCRTMLRPLLGPASTAPPCAAKRTRTHSQATAVNQHTRRHGHASCRRRARTILRLAVHIYALLLHATVSPALSRRASLCVVPLSPPTDQYTAYAHAAAPHTVPGALTAAAVCTPGTARTSMSGQSTASVGKRRPVCSASGQKFVCW